jgi:small subunit ribosomal protein S21
MARSSLLLSLLLAIVAYGNAFTVVAPVSSRQGTSRVLSYSNSAVPEQLAHRTANGCRGKIQCKSVAATVSRFFLLSKNSVSSKIDTALSVKIKVAVGDGEPIESALRRFKREVNKSGHLMELRHKRYFENPQQRAIRKVKEGRLRRKFERMAKRRQRSQV